MRTTRRNRQRGLTASSRGRGRQPRKGQCPGAQRSRGERGRIPGVRGSGGSGRMQTESWPSRPAPALTRAVSVEPGRGRDHLWKTGTWVHHCRETPSRGYSRKGGLKTRKAGCAVCGRLCPGIGHTLGERRVGGGGVGEPGASQSSSGRTTHSIQHLQSGLGIPRIVLKSLSVRTLCRQDQARAESDRQNFPAQACRADQGHTAAPGGVTGTRPGLGCRPRPVKPAPQAGQPELL